MTNAPITTEEAVQYCVNCNIISMRLLHPKKNHLLREIRIHPIKIKNSIFFQFELLTADKAFHENIPQHSFAEKLTEHIHSFSLLECQTNQKAVRLKRKGDSFTLKTISQHAAQEQAVLEHNRHKHSLLSIQNHIPLFVTLGIALPNGTIKKTQYRKFRQINKFLEFITEILPTFNGKKDLTIVEFGCGKAFLSFLLYHYLTTEKGIRTTMSGFDLKPSVIKNCTKLAHECLFENMQFFVGDIANAAYSKHTDMMICLHACDTATDHSIARAVQNNTPVIMAVPCCQHELNTQLRSRHATTNPMMPMLAYGLMRERFSSLLTDTLRAKLLEVFGYRVNIMEFIETEHTPKNILLRAVKKTHHTEADRKAAYTEYRALTNFFSVSPALETLLQDNL